MPIGFITGLIREPEIIAALLTALLTAVGWLLRPNAKVVWGASHQFAFNVPQASGGTMLIYTKTIFVRNLGRAAARDIEIHFAHKPEHLQIWPTFQYTVASNPEHYFMVVVSTLGPREYFSIEVIQSVRDIPLVTRLRTVDGECKQIAMAPQQIFGRWFTWTVVSLLVLGIFAVIELLIRLYSAL